MSWPKFLGLTALGTSLWASIVVLAGVVFHDQLVALLDTLAKAPAGLWLGAAIVVVGTVLWRLRQRNRQQLRTDTG